MNNAHKCPQCKEYILGTYCCKCKKDIKDMKLVNPLEGTPLGDIFKSFNKGED